MASPSQVTFTRQAHVCSRPSHSNHYASPTKLISSRMYKPSFAKTTSACPNHGLTCENIPQIHNLESLLDYDQEENERFVKEAQENLRLMEVASDVGSGDGFETFTYIDFTRGELNKVLDDNYLPPMLKYSYVPLRKMCRRTGLILDLPHHQVGEKFMKPQFVGTRFNINGLKSLEPSERLCEYRMHYGDMRDVGVNTDQDTVVLKIPLQHRRKYYSVYGLSESEFINEHGAFYEGMTSQSESKSVSKSEEVSEEVKKLVKEDI